MSFYFPPTLPAPTIGTGQVLGSAVSTAPFTVTAAVAPYLGLSVPVTAPAGFDLDIRGLIPAVLLGAVATTVVVEIFRDGAQIPGAAIISVPANQFGAVPFSIPDTPTPGPHIYQLQIGLGAASATTVSQSGASVFGLYNIEAFMEVVTA